MAARRGTLIIAEAGVNHNGSLERALALIDAAVEIGADIVKFQTFKASDLTTAAAPKAEYQHLGDDSANQQEMLRRLELDADAHHALLAHCRTRGIGFLSSPFDSGSLRFLVQILKVPALKLGSGEITNAPLLLEAARSGLPLILSTGMSSLADVEAALGVVAFGLDPRRGADRPGRAAFADAYADGEARVLLADRVTLLHCTTEYPAPVEDTNLRAIQTLTAAFGLPVGYSDHTEGIHIPLAAVALGASVIEKHFTLDCTLPGPDHRASLEPGDFGRMVKAIREVEQALGDGRKVPRPSEIKNRAIARKSLVTARAVAEGESLTGALAVKRPGDGLSPFDFWEIEDGRARRAYRPDEAVGRE